MIFGREWMRVIFSRNAWHVITACIHILRHARAHIHTYVCVCVKGHWERWSLMGKRKVWRAKTNRIWKYSESQWVMVVFFPPIKHSHKIVWRTSIEIKHLVAAGDHIEANEKLFRCINKRRLRNWSVLIRRRGRGEGGAGAVWLAWIHRIKRPISLTLKRHCFIG